MTDIEDAIHIDVHLKEDREGALKDLRAGLARTPKELNPHFFYDDAGSALFEKICTLPEYYQTRTEKALLEASAGDIIETTGIEEVLELGSGAATKTRVLLNAMHQAKKLRLYLPFDVNEWIVRRTAKELTQKYPGLKVHGIIGDFEKHHDLIPTGKHRLTIFLGGTIGNFSPKGAQRFLQDIAEGMHPGDHFLLGTDLIKDRQQLHDAYNDSQGVTADFNLNILNVVNSIADGNFDPTGFEHRAFFEETHHRIEMWLDAKREMVVDLPKAGITVTLKHGEGIRTEISTKFDQEKVSALLESAGMRLEKWYTDPDQLFALSLARRI